MANNRNTYQQQNNVSINKNKLLDIAQDPDLSKIDYKVLITLFTELNGWRGGGYNNRGNNNDPKNFKRIDVERIADSLDVEKKKVKKSIDKLLDFGLIEKGSSRNIKKGYRFTF